MARGKRNHSNNSNNRSSSSVSEDTNQENPSDEERESEDKKLFLISLVLGAKLVTALIGLCLGCSSVFWGGTGIFDDVDNFTVADKAPPSSSPTTPLYSPLSPAMGGNSNIHIPQTQQQQAAAGGSSTATMAGNSPSGWESQQIDPSITFALLRESVLANGGFVHPDLGFVYSDNGVRGIGLVTDSYTLCQVNCYQDMRSLYNTHNNGNMTAKTLDNTYTDVAADDDGECYVWDPNGACLLHSDKYHTQQQHNSNGNEQYTQEEILIKIPLQCQMTRAVALKTLTPLFPAEVHRRAPLTDLDDAALLVLLLAYEKGIEWGESRFVAYIASLPDEPTCGYALQSRGKAIDTVNVLRKHYNMDVQGWASEIHKAGEYADRIASGLARDYGQYIKTPTNWTIYHLIRWSLCHVTSRATAGSVAYGSLRLVPFIDLINHDVSAGGFIELIGNERLDTGDFLNATETDAGAFVVRNVKNNRPKRLRLGEELRANYNVPGYSPLDWFLNLGFVPRERIGQWTYIDAAF